MRTPLVMPKLGLTMTEAAIVEWLVRPGEIFAFEQPIVVIESEKAAVEVPAEAPGQLLEWLAQPGDTVPVGQAIAWLQVGADAAGPAGAKTDTQNNADADPGTPAAVMSGSGSAPVEGGPASVDPGAAVQAGSAAPIDARPARDQQARILSTPLARRLAAEQGIDLRQIVGSGPRGRIRAVDLRAARADQPPASDATRPLTSAQQVIARRMVAAKQEIPHFYLASEVEVSALLELHRQLRDATGPRLTLNTWIVAAVGRALAETPQVNQVWDSASIRSLASCDVGLAVQTPRGLVAPVLRRVDRLAMGELARQSQSLIDSARSGRVPAESLGGGAITVSNAGMHDVTWMTSIINPGQSMILGVGSVRELFRPDDRGQPVLKRELGLVLSADHRVLDGVTALAFLQSVRRALAQPLTLLVT